MRSPDIEARNKIARVLMDFGAERAGVALRVGCECNQCASCKIADKAYAVASDAIARFGLVGLP